MKPEETGEIIVRFCVESNNGHIRHSRRMTLKRLICYQEPFLGILANKRVGRLWIEKV